MDARGAGGQGEGVSWRRGRCWLRTARPAGSFLSRPGGSWKPAAAVGLALAASGCDARPDQWDAFVYPDRNDTWVKEEIPGFKTFELCQQAAINRLSQLPDPDQGDYECGYRCAPDPEFGGMKLCKETRK